MSAEDVTLSCMCLFIEHGSYGFTLKVSQNSVKKKKDNSLLAFFFLLVHAIGSLQNHAIVIFFKEVNSDQVMVDREAL